MPTSKDLAKYTENYNSLISGGVNADWLNQNYGNQIRNKQYDPILQQWQTTGMQQYQQAQNPNIPTMNDLAGQKYSFDPNQYLPQIQQTAASIYDPQRQQLQALQSLQTSQTQQARIKTNEDFDKQLQADIEAINARGAFFSGGGVNAQAGVEKQRGYALQDINFQDQAAQAGFLAQQAGLSASQAEYIQQKLTGAENSAYSRWQDNRNFMMSLTQAQQDQLNSDRTFQENVREFGLEYALEKKRLKQSSNG